MNSPLACFVVSISVLLLPIRSAAEVTRTVDLSGEGEFTSIQACLDASTDGDTCRVNPGLYQENIDFQGKDIVLVSRSGPDVTTIDGNGADSVVTFSGGESAGAILEGFLIQNGFAADSGGGIFCASSPLIRRCLIRENHANGFGGGIYCQGSPVISDCVIEGNSAAISGGGVMFSSGGLPTIRDSIIRRNTATLGAGFYPGAAQTTVSGCTLAQNVAESEGGGIYCTTRLSMSDSIIEDNIADMNGGGIVVDYARATMTNCLILQNKTPGEHYHGYGGGIFSDHSRVNLANVSILENAASHSGGSRAHGGGIYAYGSLITISNAIFWANTATLGPSLYVGNEDEPSSVTIRYSDIMDGTQGAIYTEEGCTLNWEGDNLEEQPLFVPGPLGPYYLSQPTAGQGDLSPCVDAGDPATATWKWWTCTTRTDNYVDTVAADMGFHYPVEESVQYILEMDANFLEGELALFFRLRLQNPALWGTFLVVTHPSPQILPLWAIPLPSVLAPVDIPVSFPFPELGWTGIYSFLLAETGPEEATSLWLDIP